MELTKQGFEYRDSDHSYFMDGKRMTGCTTILGVLAKPALVPWSARMAVEYIEENTTAFVDKLVVKDGKTLAELFEGAKKAYAKKRDEGAQKGTDVHAEVERYIKDCIENNGGKSKLELTYTASSSLHAFIEWGEREDITFIASEAMLYSKSLFIAGTADFIFEKEGKRYVGDIKTYKKIWDRTPFYQCAGYALMYEEMNELLWDSQSKENKIAGYVIFNLPKERAFKESEDVLWSFDIEGDTRAFLACVELYRQNANFKPNYNKIK